MDTKSKVDARFKFVPQGSQLLVTVFGYIAVCAALLACAFCLTSNPWIALAPFGIFCVSAGLAWWGWGKSHRYADLKDAPPTAITTTPYGYNLSTDPRALSDPGMLAGFTQALLTLHKIQPAPHPVGMVNADGTPNLSRAAEGAVLVDKVNAAIQQQRDETVALLRELNLRLRDNRPPLVQTNPAAPIDAAQLESAKGSPAQNVASEPPT
jgi:hypothetical protein